MMRFFLAAISLSALIYSNLASATDVITINPGSSTVYNRLPSDDRYVLRIKRPSSKSIAYVWIQELLI